MSNRPPPIIRRVLWVPLLCLAWMTGCSALPTPAPTPAPGLSVTLLYPDPLGKTEIEMGQALRVIARVTDSQGHPVTDGKLTVTVHDPKGHAIGAIEATPDSEGTYRGGPWAIPHRISEGAYPLSLEARRGGAASQSVCRDERCLRGAPRSSSSRIRDLAGGAVGEASGSLQIRYSTSDTLLYKYGFWLDAPTLGGIDPQLVAERGTASDGMIRRGGILPAQHVLPENWVEVHWRHGRYDLEDAGAVRRFMLEKIGDLGFTPIRSIGPFEPFHFKGWDAWKVGGRGQVRQNEVEWVAFYAPEVDKTYLIGTMVTLPPVGIDPHAALRDSFEVHPEVHASGIAPEPLPDLLPGPELLAPPLGARFYGTDQPIILQWQPRRPGLGFGDRVRGAPPGGIIRGQRWLGGQPVKELAADEYYQVSVDYNYRETNSSMVFRTRETQLALPESLYNMPNCGVFNWQVTLMRQTGTGDPGQPISHASLYWYVEWRYPPGVQAPFILACPNAQF